MKKFLCLLTVLILIFIFPGCKENIYKSSANSEVLTYEKTDSKTEIISVISLGYYEDYNQYIKEIKSSKYSSKYTFLNSLKEKEFISASNGTQTFAIIPAPSTISVSVHKLKHDENLDKTQKGDLLYNSSQLKPIVIKCNSSDIFPDAVVTILNNDGNITEFSLQLSMKDSQLEIISDTKHLIKDLTEYY